MFPLRPEAVDVRLHIQNMTDKPILEKKKRDLKRRMKEFTDCIDEHLLWNRKYGFVLLKKKANKL